MNEAKVHLQDEMSQVYQKQHMMQNAAKINKKGDGDLKSFLLQKQAELTPLNLFNTAIEEFIGNTLDPMPFEWEDSEEKRNKFLKTIPNNSIEAKYLIWLQDN